jgi:hypothetical protein
VDKIKITTPDKPDKDPHARQKAWKARNPDKVRAYHRQYMRERRAAMRPENFIIAKAK